jgi:hypothetical protein
MGCEAAPLTCYVGPHGFRPCGPSETSRAPALTRARRWVSPHWIHIANAPLVAEQPVTQSCASTQLVEALGGVKPGQLIAHAYDGLIDPPPQKT